MKYNKSALLIIAFTGIFLFIMESATSSFAQVNQTSNNQTKGNQSSFPSSVDTSANTSRINGSSIYTSNEHATLSKNPSG